MSMLPPDDQPPRPDQRSIVVQQGLGCAGMFGCLFIVVAMVAFWGLAIYGFVVAVTGGQHGG